MVHAVLYVVLDFTLETIVILKDCKTGILIWINVGEDLFQQLQ